ncbi:MAG TPA: GNAT family N-acetyltransferase [Vicinamibacterales bacterium]|nr:GNAT family N-acetyltransferase [Vicinamibacterales bacterium]
MELQATYELVTPVSASEWRAYHDIRRQVLFEARGQFGVYDENRPDDRAPGNHPRLLVYDGQPIGVVRIDIDGSIALLRRVAVRADVQRLGHGRALISLAERFAEERGCTALASFVAPDAVGFYQRCGFAIEDNPVRSEGQSVFMTKSLAQH